MHSWNKSYSCIKKSLTRILVTGTFKKYIKPGDSILALETSQYHFIHDMGKYYSYILPQISKLEYNKMQFFCPRLKNNNVITLLHQPVALTVINNQFKFVAAWFDYCNSFKLNRRDLEYMAPLLMHLKVLAFTFSMRGEKNSIIKFKAFTSKFLPRHQCVFTHSYRDGCVMFVAILIRRDLYAN